MSKWFDDECPRPLRVDAAAVAGLAPGIFPASVYRCADPEQAEGLLSGQLAGYAYQRDGHPNADLLAEKCRLLHQAQWALITSTGMSALALATLTLLRAGQHVVVSDQLYGGSTQLLTRQWPNLGIDTTVVNALDAEAVRAALRPTTRLVIVETLTNPLLRIAPLDELAKAAHSTQARLLVDNTLATPAVCRPLEHGADYVVESISKMINGHSDVMLGLLCGRDDERAVFRDALAVWGMTSSPFDSWLALRGVATLHLRMERASGNANFLAERLATHPAVSRVIYPGLRQHPDRTVAQRLFAPDMAGNMLALELPGGRSAVRQFMAGTPQIPFCPSLGEASTTLSHPASTSHRGLTPRQRAELGITEGTIRLSVGTESAEWVWGAIQQSLDTLA